MAGVVEKIIFKAGENGVYKPDHAPHSAEMVVFWKFFKNKLKS